VIVTDINLQFEPGAYGVAEYGWQVLSLCI